MENFQRQNHGTDAAVRIMPNPANDLLQVQFPTTTSGRWWVTDLSGRKMVEGTIEPSLSVSTISWPSGLYLLHSELSSGVRSSTKFTIIH